MILILTTDAWITGQVNHVRIAVYIYLIRCAIVESAILVYGWQLHGELLDV